MQYEIEVDGRLRQVVVHRVGDGFAVEVDGRRWQVDLARVDSHTLSLITGVVPPNGDTGDATPASDSSRRPGVGPLVSPRPGGPSREVIVSSGTDGRLVVRVGATAFSVALNGRRRTDEMVAGTDGPQRIVAPMPGKIVRVLVGVGDAVHARQALIVVEAMKMENELRAARDGTVAGIHVKEGVSVEAGAPLIDIL
ncbi:MAG: biotin/lipoyl-containing protein [Acidobacteriota bacterium]